MPAYVLTHQQVQTVLSMAGLEAGPGSPLANLPEATNVLGPGDAAYQKMVEGHLLEVQDGKWRVNTLAAAVLLACARPEEVIALRATGGEGQGFTICRRGPLVSECSVGGPALVKLSFPLTRSAVMLMLVSALSSDRPEPASTGFRFRGRAEDAFVLSVVLNEVRSPSGAPAVEQLAEIVAAAVEKPAYTLPFVLVAGAEPLLALARSRDAVDAAVGRLAIAGHVRNEGGRLVPSDPALTALGDPPLAGFTVSRTVVGPQGPASQTLQVVRCGERSIVFRLLRHEGEQPLFEWLEVNKLQLRALVTATLMDEEELKLAAVEPPAGRFCPNCGTRTREGQRFCRSCGQNLEEGAA